MWARSLRVDLETVGIGLDVRQGVSWGSRESQHRVVSFRYTCVTGWCEGRGIPAFDNGGLLEGVDHVDCVEPG